MALQLSIHPSRYLLAFIFLMHVVAVLLLLTLPWQGWLRSLLAICLALSFVYNARYYVLRKAADIVIELWLDENKTWHLLRRDGKAVTAKLMSDSVCSTALVVLNFKVINPAEIRQKYSVVIFPDSIDAVSHRRLRAWFNSQ